MSPLFLAILFSRYFMCSFHDKLSSNKAPRNLIVLALSISWMFVFNVGRWERILYFLRNLWNNENLVFPAFSDSLFAENHTLILINWSLTLIMMWLCYRAQKNIVCEHYWRKNIWRIREMAYINKNNDSPSNEPCGTPHLISFFTVLEDSVIFIYFFLPFK